MNGLVYKRLTALPEIRRALRFCMKVFDRSSAPLFTPEGKHSFHAFVMGDEIEDAAAEGRAVFFAAYDSAAQTGRLSVFSHEMPIAGVICLRDTSHISLLFVDEAHRRMGIASSLLDMAAEGAVRPITVNAAPTGYDFYRARGFLADAPEIRRNGLIYTRMILY